MKISKGKELDVDAIWHRIMETCVYGKFKLQSSIIDDKGVVFGGLEMILRVVKKK